ncbi:MAG: hypothetical protein R6W78_03800 [Bacteroidales bacterium]
MKNQPPNGRTNSDIVSEPYATIRMHGLNLSCIVCNDFLPNEPTDYAGI